MDCQRRRDPPAPYGFCVRCGWRGTPPNAPLLDEHGDVSLWVSAKHCPQCGQQLIKPDEAKPPLPVEFVTAVRDANLTPEQIGELTDAARGAGPDTSPRELAKQVPAASQVIVVATRAGGDRWLQFLILALTILTTYLTYAGNQQAHDDALNAMEQAHEDALDAIEQAREMRDPAGLTDAEIEEVAEQIAAAIAERAK